MKIAILLPQVFDLGLLRRAQRLSRLLVNVQDPDGTFWSTAIGVPAPNETEWRKLELSLRDDNSRATVRRLVWETVPAGNAQRMFPAIADSLDLTNINHVLIARDWGWNFQDCDAAICFGDAELGAVFTLIPTVFYCTDLAVRIAPGSWAQSIYDNYWRLQTDSFRLWRQARVTTSDPGTAEDLLSYAGVRRSRIFTNPNVLTLPPERPVAARNRDPSTLAWLLTPGPLHDLENAAKALGIYLAEGGNMRPVLVLDRLRDPKAGDLAGCAGLRSDLADVIYSLPSLLVESDEELFRVLARSGAIWSSRIAGGEGEACLLAKEAGVAFLGADFRINRSTVEQHKIAAELYDLVDPLAIVDALHRLEGLVSADKIKNRNSSAGTDQSAHRAHFEKMIRLLAADSHAA